VYVIHYPADTTAVCVLVPLQLLTTEIYCNSMNWDMFYRPCWLLPFTVFLKNGYLLSNSSPSPCQSIKIPASLILMCFRRPNQNGVAQQCLKSKSYPRNWPWRPIGLWDVKDPTLSRQSAHRWCEVVSPTPQKHYFYDSGTHFCLRLSKPQDLVRLEGLGKFKKSPHRVSNLWPSGL
jgi:hypothetical protein